MDPGCSVPDQSQEMASIRGRCRRLSNASGQGRDGVFTVYLKLATATSSFYQARGVNIPSVASKCLESIKDDADPEKYETIRGVTGLVYAGLSGLLVSRHV